MYLHPTRRTGNIIPLVFAAPSLNETHADRAHLGQLVNRLKPMMNGFIQQLCERGIVENLQRAPRWYFADGGIVEAVAVVAVLRLDEDRLIRQAFSVHFSVSVIQMNT